MHEVVIVLEAWGQDGPQVEVFDAQLGGDRGRPGADQRHQGKAQHRPERPIEEVAHRHGIAPEDQARGDFYAADLARRTAHLMALGSRRWDAMAAVGDAYVRFVASPGASPTLRPEARRIYCSALFRAHQQGSIEGVLRVSEALAALGDKEVAREGLAMAAAMAAAASHGPYDAARAEALTERLDNQASSHEESARDLGAPAASAVTWTR